MASSSQILLPLKVVHLDKEDEIQKIPLQPPYYDMAQSESTAFTDKPVSSAAKLIAVCPFSCFGGSKSTSSYACCTR